MKRFLGCLLACLAFSAHAERIVISGKPADLVIHDGYFTLPELYNPTPGYRFVMLGGQRRVCYMKPMPELAALDHVQIVIEEDDSRLFWDCYRYNPQFFEIDF